MYASVQLPNHTYLRHNHSAALKIKFRNLELVYLTMALTRIAREAVHLQRDPLEIGFAGPAKNDNPLQWDGHITGPPNTPYEQENFFFTIVFPEEYPRKPFKLTFTTPISHPNISEEGEVQLAELDDKFWSPVFTVRSILICLQALLSDPELDSGGSDSETAKSDLPTDPQKHDVGTDSAEGSREPTHHGRIIGGNKYGMEMSRPEYEVYKNLPGGAEEKDRFFTENADIVRET